MGSWIYREGKHVQIAADPTAEADQKWVIVRKKDLEWQIYLRRKLDPWANLVGWRARNAPVMTFPTKEDADLFTAGLLLTGQVEAGKFGLRRLGTGTF